MRPPVTPATVRRSTPPPHRISLRAAHNLSNTNRGSQYEPAAIVPLVGEGRACHRVRRFVSVRQSEGAVGQRSGTGRSNRFRRGRDPRHPWQSEFHYFDRRATPAAQLAGVRRRDQGKRQGLQAVVGTACRAPAGRAERVADHDRRPGLRRQRHVWRRHSDTGARSHRADRPALHPVSLDRALLAHARRADHRPQSS